MSADKTPEQPHLDASPAAVAAEIPPWQPPSDEDSSSESEFEYAHRLSWGIHVWQRLKREPALAVTLAYMSVALIGIWSSYWYYRAFRIDILEYFQASDFIVAGLRDPMSFAFLGAMFVIGLISYWPVAYELRHPQRVADFRGRLWGRIVFWSFASPLRRRRWYDISPEFVFLLALLLGGGSLLITRSWDRAAAVIASGGQPLRVTLQGSVRPLLGEARLLGTSSAFIFIYWPANGRAEALPQESILRLEMLPREIAGAGQ